MHWRPNRYSRRKIVLSDKDRPESAEAETLGWHAGKAKPWPSEGRAIVSAATTKNSAGGYLRRMVWKSCKDSVGHVGHLIGV